MIKFIQFFVKADKMLRKILQLISDKRKQRLIIAYLQAWKKAIHCNCLNYKKERNPVAGGKTERKLNYYSFGKV